jgi:hypothetical protein
VEEVTCTYKREVEEKGTCTQVEVVTCICKLVVEEKGIYMAYLVVVEVNCNGKEEEVSELEEVESDSSKALVVVVEMNRYSCLLKFGLASKE